MRRALFVAVAALALMTATIGDASAARPTQGPPAGATDKSVTDANAATTICASPAASTPKLSAAAQTKVFVRSKITAARRGRYVVDLLVPSSLGGIVSNRNLWPQLRADATTKNATEQLLHSLVCSGLIELTTAQQAITTDWTTAGTQAQAAADARKTAVGTFIAAQAEAERQAALAGYLASLPPPTTAPPVTNPPSVDGSTSTPNPRTDCPATFQGKRCYLVGQQMCQGWYAVLTCTVVEQGPGFQDARWL